MDKVVNESRHKFVYFDEDDRDVFVNAPSRYAVDNDDDEPVAVYVCDSGLSDIDNKLRLDKNVIISFHNSYYELLIFLAIIDTLISQIDRDTLNYRFRDLFELCSMSEQREINDVIELRSMLMNSKNIYKYGYMEYMNTGEINFYDDIEIPFVVIDTIVSCIKDCLGLQKHFSILLDIEEDMSLYNQMAINSYIASRCNGYLSMNVLLSNCEWKYYYSSNGQLIEYVHDYTEIDLRKNRDKIKSRHN